MTKPKGQVVVVVTDDVTTTQLTFDNVQSGTSGHVSGDPVECATMMKRTQPT